MLMLMLGLLLLYVLTFLGIEFYYSKVKHIPIYDLKASLSNLALSAGQQVVNTLTHFPILIVYYSLYSRFHLFELNDRNVLHWIVAILLSDLCFYVLHRSSHRVNVLVAIHGVHHQAKDFNHISATRQSWFLRPVMFLFYLPLALFGIPPEMLFSALLLNMMVQFWSHNGAIRRNLGWIEYVFITPRSHRVHHGSNEPYLDRNFGGAFSIWDRIFGTFQEAIDDIPIQIGWDSSARYMDPVASQIQPFRVILEVAGRRKSLWEKVKVWFGSPEALYKEYEASRSNEDSLRSSVTTVSTQRDVWIWFSLVVLTAVAFTMLFGILGWVDRLAGFGIFLMTGVCFGRSISSVWMTERRGLHRRQLLKVGKRSESKARRSSLESATPSTRRIGKSGRSRQSKRARTPLY